MITAEINVNVLEKVKLLLHPMCKKKRSFSGYFSMESSLIFISFDSSQSARSIDIKIFITFRSFLMEFSANWKSKDFSIAHDQFRFVSSKIFLRDLEINRKISWTRWCFFHFYPSKRAQIISEFSIFLYHLVGKKVLYPAIPFPTSFSERIPAKISILSFGFEYIFEENVSYITISRRTKGKEKEPKTKACLKWESIESTYKYPCRTIIKLI